MKLSPIDRFEIQAEAFRIMTGNMAPGKDVSPQAYSADIDERQAAFNQWCEAYGDCVRVMMVAFERVMPGNEDDAV